MDEQKPNGHSHVAETVGTMRDQMATKADLLRLEQNVARLEDKMEAGFSAVVSRIDQVQTLRTTEFEAQLKRIRSVVYVLVREQPDVVRMLGPEW